MLCLLKLNKSVRSATYSFVVKAGTPSPTIYNYT